MTNCPSTTVPYPLTRQIMLGSDRGQTIAVQCPGNRCPIKTMQTLTGLEILG